jgi:hypothetical protein
MKRSIKIKTVTLAVLIALANYMGGCSVVGLGMGAAVDYSKDEYKKVEGKQLVSIKPGTPAVLNLKDGSQLIGNYDGLAVKKTDNDIAADSLIVLQNADSLAEKTNYSYISLRSIDSVLIKNKKDLKYIGLGFGLIIDALITAAAISISGSMGMGG